MSPVDQEDGDTAQQHRTGEEPEEGPIADPGRARASLFGNIVL